MALKLTILGDWKGAKEALKSTRDYAQKTAKSIKGIFSGTLGNLLSPLGLGLSAAGLATAVGAIVGELDKIGKSADNLGVTTDYFQRLEYAAQRTNTPIEQVSESLGKVKRMAAEALNGNAPAADLFARLRISAEELRNLRPEQLFDRVNAAMRNVTDARERDFIASKLYGESFQKLNNFLRDYVALGDEFANSGNLIDEADIRAAEALDDAITDLKKSLTSLVVDTGIIKFCSELADLLGALGDEARALKALSRNGGDVKPDQMSYRNEPKWHTGLRWFNNGIGGLAGMGWLWGKGLGDTLSPYRPDDYITAPFTEADRKRGTPGVAGGAPPTAAPPVIDPYLSRLEREFRYEQNRLKNGDRAAWIDKELESIRDDYKRRNQEFSPEEEARQRELAGQLWDLRHPAAEEKKGAPAAEEKKGAPAAFDALPESAREVPLDSMARIGAYNGFQRTSAENQMQYARNSAEAAQSIDRKLDRVLTSIDPELNTQTLIAP